MFKNLLNLLIVASLTVGVGVTLTVCADKAPIPTEQNLIVNDSIFDEIVNNTLFRVEKQSLVNKINDFTNQIKNLDKNIYLCIIPHTYDKNKNFFKKGEFIFYLKFL
ncbi:hypothetical protein [Spiroplasma endosymbiont of Eupeodes luniger]|uniref:hypothetical protein n=1 Tax=Spiroplasma endosymbiont of Eupeodes luniger TaxID=3066300 RepID=UPI0030D5E981